MPLTMTETGPARIQVVDESGRIIENEKYVQLSSLAACARTIAVTAGLDFKLDIPSIVENYLIPYDTARPQFLRYADNADEPKFRISECRHPFTHQQMNFIAVSEAFAMDFMKAIVTGCHGFIVLDEGTSAAGIVALKANPARPGTNWYVTLNRLQKS
jgi:hypothetical protein